MPRVSNRTPNAPGAQPGQRSSAGAQQQTSPAYTMAARIRNEQGAQRAGEYLAAMEPYLAPGERAHIAASLGVPFIQYRDAPGRTAQQSAQQSAPQQSAGGLSDAMQMMQMLSALGSLNGGSQNTGANAGAGMNNPMMLAQMLGSLMGKK